MTTSQERWEYCRFEDVLGKGFVAAKLVYLTAEGEKTESFVADEESSQRSIVAMKIAELGNEGWEMVGTGITGQGSHAIYFKRKRD